MTAHVMVDMETAGTGPDAAILSVGLVQFDPATGEQLSSCSVKIDLRSAVEHGGVIEPGTMQWWAEQSDAAREVFNSKDATDFMCAMLRVQSYLDVVGPAYIWSNGAGFDPKTDMPFEGTVHNALDDAVHQVKYVSAIWQRLFSKESEG